jgi:hypothetical protein
MRLNDVERQLCVRILHQYLPSSNKSAFVLHMVGGSLCLLSTLL